MNLVGWAKRHKIIVTAGAIIFCLGATGPGIIFLGCTADMWSLFNIIDSGDLGNNLGLLNSSILKNSSIPGSSNNGPNNNSPSTTVAPRTMPTTVAPRTTPSTVTPRTTPTTVTPKTTPTTITPRTKTTAVTPRTIPTTVTPRTIPTTVTPRTIPTTVTPRTKTTAVTPRTIPTTVTPRTIPTTVTPRTIPTTVTTRTTTTPTKIKPTITIASPASNKTDNSNTNSSHIQNSNSNNSTTTDNENVVIIGESPKGTDKDAKVNKKRDFIKKMMKDAWDNYVKYAWGGNELKPVSQTSQPSSLDGKSKIGATIVDSVDTLYIMGMEKEYLQGRKWIARNLNFDHNEEVSVFEMTIRFLGGLLAAYAITGDSVYKGKAYKLGKKLLPAFNTRSGIPHALVEMESGESKNYGWIPDRASILSEFGSLHLEFVYLSDITGDPIFKEKVTHIRKVLQDIDKPEGLYSNYVSPITGNFTVNKFIAMGAFGDSFYEYLLKSYIQTGDNDARVMYDEAMEALEKNGLILKSKGGLLYFAQIKNEEFENKMEHLACFTGGMFGLGSITDPKLKGQNVNKKRSRRHMEIAKGITKTCHESYIRTHTRLGPERFEFNEEVEATAVRDEEKYYILRPEVIESYFILWRITGDEKYREWGWDAAQAIQKYCKVGLNGGYGGIKNVYDSEPQQEDEQHTFFLAETLKYLYLLFSSNELMDLKYWVFNTEAHPLPINGTNPYYRQSKPKSA